MGASSLAPADFRQLLSRMDGYLTIWSDEERGALEVAIDSVLEASTDNPSRELDWWRTQRLGLRLAGRSGRAQLELLLDEACDRKRPGVVRARLLDITQDDIREVLGRFDVEGDRETVLGWLTLLVEISDHRALDGWSGLPALLRHADAEVAELAIALASESTDLAVLEVIAEMSWTAMEVTDRAQCFRRSIALLQASLVLKRPDLLARADREMAAAWLQRDPGNLDALHAYEHFIRGAISSSKSRRARYALPLIKHERAVTILLDRASEAFWAWLDNFISNEINASDLDLMSEFPLRILAEALMSRRPDLGLMLWGKLKTAMEDGVVKISNLISLPFLASGDIADEARNRVLTGIVNDQELADLAQQAGKHGRIVWLVDKALELARSAKTEALAMSFMLLGFADENQAVDTAWVELEELLPRGGWLEDVYLMSHQSYERNRWARHWYRCYLQASTDGEAIAAHMLLRASIDIRAVHWIDQRHVKELTASKRRFWIRNIESLNVASRKRREKLKDTLFWTKTMKQTQSPWL